MADDKQSQPTGEPARLPDADDQAIEDLAPTHVQSDEVRGGRINQIKAEI